MAAPETAIVRPRILRDGESSLLEGEVRSRLQTRPRGIVVIAGPAGSGKSTALVHLAQEFAGDARIAFADVSEGFNARRLLDLSSVRLAICVAPLSTGVHEAVEPEIWRMAPWGIDDSIEYLLSAHPHRCESVMRRIRNDAQWRELGGLPLLCRLILDRFAADESLSSIRATLADELHAQLPDATTRSAAALWCLAATCQPLREHELVELDKCEGINRVATSLLRHRLPRRILAAEQIVDDLRSKASAPLLANYFPQSLVCDVAQLIGDQRNLHEALERIVGKNRLRAQQPMAASLLFAINQDWRPANGRAPLLAGAYLAGIRWAGAQYKVLDVSCADLQKANLSESRLVGASADRADLRSAQLHGAQLIDFSAKEAIFDGADLSFVRAPSAKFCDVSFRGANLEGALLAKAVMLRIDLRNARLCRADLSRTVFRGPLDLTGADFTGANLFGARLDGLMLRHASFNSARFAVASLDEADLEGMRLPGADFAGAHLWKAWLTGTYMPGACFRNADLASSGLAEIDWEGADLRDADLRGCTFHLGSSRSGLVGSPIACEGSRTGFYTDDYEEQDFKSPEDIRKANLRGADLRGAKIKGVDFYLVDLRDALYTSDQEAVFRASGAILKTRV